MQDVLSIPSATGVDLNLRVAGAGARSFAFVVDWHIRLLAALAWYAAAALLLYGDMWVGSMGMDPVYNFGVLLPTAAIYFLYHPVIELIMAGRTPGKRIAGVRVVRSDGAMPGIGEILIRNVFRLIDCLPAAYCLGLAFALFTRNSVRIGDLAAGTLLVYDEPKATALQAYGGDVLDRIGMDRVELVRDLLARWDRLDALARNDMARQLLTQLDALPADRHSIDYRQELEEVLEA